MLKYIFKRILSSIVVLLGVVTITFFIARVIPSNPEVAAIFDHHDKMIVHFEH